MPIFQCNRRPGLFDRALNGFNQRMSDFNHATSNLQLFNLINVFDRQMMGRDIETLHEHLPPVRGGQGFA
jgi:hypothetical protein